MTDEQQQHDPPKPADSPAGQSQPANKLTYETFFKYLILSAVILFSTGPLLFRLFYTTLRNSCALLVGALWVLGDLLASISVLVILHDLLVVPPNFQTNQLSNLDIIRLLFIVLYTVDLVALIIGKLGANQTYLSVYKYRLTWFHIQVTLAILYTLRPSNLDLRHLLAQLDRMHSLCLRWVRSVSSRIERATSSQKLPGEQGSSQFVSDAELSAPVISLMEETRASVTSTFEPGSSGQTARSSARSSARRRTRPAATSAAPRPRTRSTTRGPQTRRRTAAAAAAAAMGRRTSPSVCQSIVQMGGARRQTTRRVQRGGTRRRVAPSPGRTVNLNLNLN